MSTLTPGVPTKEEILGKYIDPNYDGEKAILTIDNVIKAMQEYAEAYALQSQGMVHGIPNKEAIQICNDMLFAIHNKTDEKSEIQFDTIMEVREKVLALSQATHPSDDVGQEAMWVDIANIILRLPAKQFHTRGLKNALQSKYILTHKNNL